MSEAMRAELVPQVQRIALWLDLVVMLGAVIVFGAIGIKGFMRRALD